MHIYLTLDSLGTYLADGIGGLMISMAPLPNHAAFSVYRFGKELAQHRDAALIDASILAFYLPHADPRSERRVLLEVLRQQFFSGTASNQRFVTSLEVTPKDWFDWAIQIEDAALSSARHAQRFFENELPF